ncbi:hypothetical protein QYS62_004845 [Fusarium acuminatum]|uniref:Uncharacterized protein n=1 Tax=Fusarium acuminatum TaxID=5515 RepID=A0ABZ2WTT2_9HYPO
MSVITEQNTQPTITMPLTIEEQLDTFLEGDSSRFSDARFSVLEPAYDSYLFSNNLRSDEPTPSSIQLLHSSEIAITISRCTKTGVATDLTIVKISDPLADNFVGYSLEERCIVFRGERGLVDDFVGFAELVAGEKPVTIVLKALKQVRIPPQGLEYGLTFERFVDRVEVLECAMWIRTSPSEQDEGVNKFVEFISASQTPQPIPSKQTIPNDIHATDDDKPNLKVLEIHNSITDKSTFGSDSSSPLSSPPPIDESEDWEFPFSDSSSPLSPPPEIIETPPWLSHSES